MAGTTLSKQRRDTMRRTEIFAMPTSRVTVIPILMSFAAALSISPSYAEAPEKGTSFKVVGYLGGGNFRRIDELELNRLTHLNLAFANPDKDGNLVFGRGVDIAPVVNKGHAAGLKVFVSLAGGGSPDKELWKSVLLPENKSSFVRHIVDYVERNSLDGVDVDIEGSLLPTLRESYNPFVIELKNALHAKGKGITAALGATRVHESITQEAIDAYDFINVMVYDKTGIWRPDDIGQHSPYSYAEEAIVYWTGKWKLPPERIVLGVPFYGFDFTAPARYIDYSEIIAGNPALAYQDAVGMRYYNGIPTIVQKTQLARQKLGGVMIWEIASDTAGDLSLLRAVDQTIKAGNCPVKTFFKDEDGDGVGQLAKPFQACAAPKGYVAGHP
jgi:chitinase